MGIRVNGKRTSKKNRKMIMNKRRHMLEEKERQEKSRKLNDLSEPIGEVTIVAALIFVSLGALVAYKYLI